MGLAVACTLLGLCGCQKRFSIATPATPSISPADYYSLTDYQADDTAYRTATTTTPNPDLAKQARNNIAYGLMGQIDIVYGAYYNQLFSTKNSVAIGSDALTLGLSSAASIATHAATKTIFSALGTAFSGLSLSVDKNYFAQQTFPVIGVAMQTRRDKIRAALVANLALDVQSYPLLAAKRDLIAYLNAGTLASGLQELQEETGAATAATPGNAAKALTAPTNLTAQAGASQVALLWALSPGATSYNLYWGTATGVTKANGTKISVATNSYTHAGLTNGNPYFYVVTAVNASSESDASAQASASPVAPVAPAAGAPPVPGALTAVPGDAQISLVWAVSSGATSYNLYWARSAGVTPANGTRIAVPTNSYTHSTLTNGTPYYYVVTAVNANGESVASSPTSATPAAPVPSGPILRMTPH